jgi:hypothetical protein
MNMIRSYTWRLWSFMVMTGLSTRKLRNVSSGTCNLSWKRALLNLPRKLDRRIIPLLGICYLFYYVDKTTLSYAAIFGIKDDLKLVGTEYSWLSR